MASLTLHHDGPTEVAYRFVADGCRRASEVPALPDIEVEGLRICLRATLEISGQPLIEEADG